MANEVTINSKLRVVKDKLSYSSDPPSFSADLTLTIGPSPGAFTASTSGTTVDLSALTTPTFCRVMNLDTTNFVTFGVYSGAVFYPMIDVYPGETYAIRLAV